MALRDLERESIKAFLARNADKLQGRVLDIGCGKQPYKTLVESFGGTYIPYDRVSFGGSTVQEDVGADWDRMRDLGAVLMTQIWQYLTPESVIWMLRYLSRSAVIKRGGWLLVTGPTNWPVVEMADLWRATPTGARRMLHDAGFVNVAVEPRQSVMQGEEPWLCGWGAVGQCL